MNSLNSNHSSYSTPQPQPQPPQPISLLLPQSNTLPHIVLPSLTTQQQQQQPHHTLVSRQNASPGLVSSSSTTNNNNNNNKAFEPPPPPPAPSPSHATQQSLPINPHANSISPTSTSGNAATTAAAAVAATTTAGAATGNKSGVISTPTLSSANINTIQNVVPTPSSTRSMSIVSLERSARNSIVSVDENLRYHARNDSSASLASLGHVSHNTLTMTPVGNSFNGQNNRPDYNFDHSGCDSRVRSSNGGSSEGINQGSAVMTDDESEYDTNMTTSSGVPQSSDTLRTIPTTPILGATSGSMASTLTSRSMAKTMHRPKRRSFKDEVSLQHLKNDFRFKFHDIYTTPTTIPTSPVSYHHTNSHICSLNASPTSESLHHGVKHHHNDSTLEDNVLASPKLNHDTAGKQIENPEMNTTPISSSTTLFTPPVAPTKKLKSTSLIQQSLYLKRKLAFSKDLQMEFNNAYDLSNSNSTDMGSPNSALHSHLITMSPPLSTALSEAKFFTNIPSTSTVVPRRRLSSSLNDTESTRKPTSAGASGVTHGDSDGARTANADFNPTSTADFNPTSTADFNPTSTASNHIKLDFKVPTHEHDTSSANIPPLTPLRAMQSVKEQNDLITKLNKKWNRAMINNSSNNMEGGNTDKGDINIKDEGKDAVASTDGISYKEEKSKLDDANGLQMMPNKRKRSRRDSFDVDDEHSFDDFNYDHYDG